MLILISSKVIYARLPGWKARIRARRRKLSIFEEPLPGFVGHILRGRPLCEGRSKPGGLMIPESAGIV
jgi:hypothetical protein